MSKSLQMKLNILILVSLIISFLLPTPFQIFIDLVATIPVIISAVLALKNKKITVDLLASIALFVSLINHEWTSVAFINLMITSARIFGDYTEVRATNAIRSLMKLRPEKVKIKKEGSVIEVTMDEVAIGDLVIVETGDRVPIDGTIIEGEASLDQSSLTGESIPVSKVKNQKVLSSTLCVAGSLIVKTEKVGKDTTFEKIINLVESAQGNKSDITTVADRFATIYISITLVIAIIIYLVTQNITIILSVLLVACADDIAVAIPMAFWGTIAKAAKSGIIIKGGKFVEGLSKADTLIVDKTGTLTRGVIKTEKIISFGKMTSHEILSNIACIESISEHPIAKAITIHAVQDGIPIKTPKHFKEHPGQGIEGDLGKKKVLAGNIRFMQEEKIKMNPNDLKTAEDYEKEGFDVIYFAVNKKLEAILTLADEIRPEVKSTIFELRNIGIKKVVMLTGDNEFVAARVAKLVGITSYHANLLPEDKLKYLKSYLGKTGKVVFVGDGVNDAAALTASDIGIAMGAIGADTAIEAADIALMQDDFSKVAVAIKFSHFTTSIARRNFLIWGIVNSLGLILVFSGNLNPSGAAAYNFLTDFFPIANSLRVLKYKTN